VVKLELDEMIEKITKEVYSLLSIHNAQSDNFKGKSAVELAAALEYSMLNPDTTREQIMDALQVTKRLRLANICVSPYYTSFAAEYLQNTGIAVCVPVGFPHGAASTVSKVAEIREAIKNGATELDVELNILAIKSGDFDAAKKDLEELCNMAKGRAKIKAIYEQGLLNEEEKVKTLKMADSCSIDYIKISNALTGKNACVEDVQFVRSIISRYIGIKIDGGIRSAELASQLLSAGANRFGVSKPELIITDTGIKLL
jgi:deoxyribose-phosphate aldolase